MQQDDKNKEKTPKSDTPNDAQIQITKEEEILSLQKLLEEAEKQIENLTSTSKRALADLVNFKRRVEEEKKHFVHFANAGLLQEILQVVDNFERALSLVPENLKENDWVKGVISIENQLKTILVKQGVKEIKTLGEKIDPYLHEAIMTEKGEKNIILEVYERGYMLDDKILRPAKVKVGDGTQ
ncbi:nucleotide exchange factor GrpE [Candidatus Peregrinibacteria bacterium]|nr:nucleotide exchange factor GrpE [Candidatus Peregrinibacteria bacterium]